MSPRASEVSSAETPKAPATGAAYLKDSPSIATLVLALEDAAARMSAKWPESLAERPKAVNASVTMSEVVARSSPEAAARLMMPSIPSSISSVFQPAMAMYSKASPASIAENLVLAPISRALSRRSSNCSPVAPEMACTLLIWASKSAVVFTAAVPSATTGAVTFLVRLVPTEVMVLPMFSSFLPASPSLVSAVLALAASFASRSSSCSVATISRWSASYLSFPRSPLSILALACSCASFSASSFSLVAVTAVFSASCFWVSRTVFVGSSFSSRSTSFSCDWVPLMVLLTDSRALDKPVVEPFISTVIPAILEAKSAPSFHGIKKDLPAQISELD